MPSWKVRRSGANETRDHLTELSNAARKDRQIYMTKPFGDLIAHVDGPPLPEAKDRIPQKPAERPARFKNR